METDRKRLDRAVESRMEVGSIFAGSISVVRQRHYGVLPVLGSGRPPIRVLVRAAEFQVTSAGGNYWKLTISSVWARTSGRQVPIIPSCRRDLEFRGANEDADGGAPASQYGQDPIVPLPHDRYAPRENRSNLHARFYRSVQSFPIGLHSASPHRGSACVPRRRCGAPSPNDGTV